MNTLFHCLLIIYVHQIDQDCKLVDLEDLDFEAYKGIHKCNLLLDILKKPYFGSFVDVLHNRES